MKINEDKLVHHLLEYIKECDADELARVAGQVFGGTCFPAADYPDSLDFDFIPNENYAQEFATEPDEDFTVDADCEGEVVSNCDEEGCTCGVS